MGVVHRRTEDGQSWRWEGVAVEGYTTSQATKQVLVGPQDGAANFVLRYFTIPARSFSHLDQHEHDHGVVIMSGHARVMLGDRFEEIRAGDVVYIPGLERHQFENLEDEPLTFLCIIPPKTPRPDTSATPTVAKNET